MRLHIVKDEKIIDRAITNFNLVFPNENKFIVLTTTPNEHRYVQSQDNVIFARYDSCDFWTAVGVVSYYSAIIVHYLSEEAASFIEKIEHPRIYWIEWGADLYSYLLEPRGYPIYADKNILWHISSKKCPKPLFPLLCYYRKKKRQRKILKAAKKVKYFVPDSMYDEYPLIKKYYPELSHLEYREFFYYPIDEVIESNIIHRRVEGNSIIIGNSSSATGNHISVLNKLVELNLGNREVVVPLSYGSAEYTNYVRDIGVNMLKDGFVPITEYMPLQDYNKLLLSADTFIYGNWRQEAVGNILVALYLGGKVFLDSKNPLLSFYKGLGLAIYSIDELTQSMLDTPMDPLSVNRNRSILEHQYSRERQLELIKSNF